MEAERARQAEEEAQRQASLLQEALESLRSGDNPHLALHQLQLLHRLPLESVLSLQAQLCSCLHAVEQVMPQTYNLCTLLKLKTCMVNLNLYGLVLFYSSIFHFSIVTLLQ